MRRHVNRPASAAEQAQMACALLSAVRDLGVASTDDAHDRYELPSAAEPRTWGAVTTGLTASGLIRRVDDRATRRRVAHGRRIGLYDTPDLERVRGYIASHQAAEPSRRARQLTLPGMD